MILDITYVAAASAIIALIIPLYIYKDKLFKAAPPAKDDITLFVNDIKLHMKNEHPKIFLEYSIVQQTKNEEDSSIRKTIIMDNIVSQFFNQEYTIKTQKPVSKDKLWSTYIQNSKPNAKHPSDWPQRKELAHKRDDEKCNRCGTKIKVKDASTNFVKPVSQGGGYNLENIVILCSDCNAIINSENQAHTMNNLQLNDALLKFS